MDNQIFKIGDRVFDIRYGWGEIEHIYLDGTVNVHFGNIPRVYRADGKITNKDIFPLLSFTEYRFDDKFSQERPINYTEYEGKWGKFWNDEDSSNKIVEISMLEKVEYEKFDRVKFASIATGTYYDNFTPLTDEQLKMLGLK